MISIIIPAFNEEKYLPLLLDSIKTQSFSEYEIIVADNSSKDNTRKVAEKYNCRVVKGGHPGKARNNGAKAAKHDLLFIDADVILPNKDFLERFLKKAEQYEMATCKVDPDSKRPSHKVYYAIKNILNRYNPQKHVSGQFLFVRKFFFEEIGGYDETLYFGEEHDLAHRASRKNAKIGFFKMHVLNSPRRLNKEGILRQFLKSAYSEIYRFFRGKAKKQIIKYEYGNY